MFKRVLVPLDGSDRAEQAIPVAARLARTSGGVVILVQVVPLAGFSEKKLPEEMYDEVIIEEVNALPMAYLEHVSKMAELVGVRTETRVEYGEVAPSILAAVEPLEVDLIVMCSHGHSGFKRWALGSIAHKIITHGPVPVLLLRDGGPTLTTKALEVLVALDGSPVAETVLGPIVQLATALAPSMHATLHLVRVVDVPAGYGYGRFAANAFTEQLREEAKHEAQAYLSATAQRLIDREETTQDVIVTTSIAVNPDVAEVLVQLTEEKLHTGGRFDLLAMATHGRGGLQRWVIGSVTERVLHHSRLPVLVVRAVEQSKHMPEAQGQDETAREQVAKEKEHV
jgi:nucleotide-binding universal stress UspA family protein